MSFEKPIKSAK